MTESNPVDSLGLAEARRIALAAQGFGARRSEKPAGWRRVRGAIERMGLLQVDSVSVLVRAHYLPVFSRLGPYDLESFDRKAFHPRRRALFEYWAHECSLLPFERQPLLRWRMARARRGQGIYKELARFARERRDYVEDALAQVRARGALAANELRNPGKRGRAMWDWHDGKRALEVLFWTGDVTTAMRRGSFERVYDLPERVLPRAVVDAPTPEEDKAQRALLMIAARALGVATETDLRDYFRLPVADTKRRLAELVEAGALLPIKVQGWRQVAYLDPEARCPRRVAFVAAATGRRHAYGDAFCELRSPPGWLVHGSLRHA